MTTGTSKLKVLLVGEFIYSKQKWSELEEIAEVIQSESTTREQFIQDLKTKYNDITCIARTFYSINETGRFDADLVRHMPKTLKSVSHCGAGYDQVDVEPFTRLGVQVSNVTEPVERPTADVAVFLVLACMRNFLQGRQILMNGEWPSNGDKEAAGAPLGHTPQGKVVGILGMGGIGRAIRDRLKPFGFDRIVYYNRKQLSPELEKGAEYVTMDELFKQSDVIIIGVPLNAKTRHLIDKEAIQKMKDGVVLVNIARGAIIDEKHLPELIKSGKIGAFGADVFEHEPEVSAELVNLPNVVALPHMGTHSVEALTNMEEWVVCNVETFIKTGKLKTIVPEQQGIF